LAKNSVTYFMDGPFQFPAIQRLVLVLPDQSWINQPAHYT